MEDSALVDSIYEAAFRPDLWSDVLERIAQIVGARGGHMFLGQGKITKWAASPAMREGVAVIAASDILARSERQRRLFAAGRSGFIVDHDIFSDEELEDEPFYRDFLRPYGLGWAAGTAIAMPTGDNLSMGFERRYKSGPITPDIVKRLDALRPHLARSAFLSFRQQMECARAATETLALLGLPALVTDLNGKVLVANALADGLSAHLRWRAADRFTLKDLGADVLLRDALATLGRDELAPVRSFPIRDEDHRAALVAHVLPLRGSARDIFSRCAAILVLTSVAMPQGPPVELIQSLFDLSAAEAQVARGLAGGRSLDEIAAGNGVSKNTVRAQLRSVLEKTGCRRQAEVAVLLNGQPVGMPHR